MLLWKAIHICIGFLMDGMETGQMSNVCVVRCASAYFSNLDFIALPKANTSWPTHAKLIYCTYAICESKRNGTTHRKENRFVLNNSNTFRYPHSYLHRIQVIWFILVWFIYGTLHIQATCTTYYKPPILDGLDMIVFLNFIPSPPKEEFPDTNKE